mgnify:CR=1 FL=1
MPLFAHAGLALAIGLGALVNALWLLVGLIRRGSFRPLPGWPRFVLQVLVPAALPSILAGLRIGWAFAWRTLIAAFALPLAFNAVAWPLVVDRGSFIRRTLLLVGARPHVLGDRRIGK